eukprot:1186496-Prorocentrum_minimum.AAC.1
MVISRPQIGGSVRIKYRFQYCDEAGLTRGLSTQRGCGFPRARPSPAVGPAVGSAAPPDPKDKDERRRAAAAAMSSAAASGSATCRYSYDCVTLASKSCRYSYYCITLWNMPLPSGRVGTGAPGGAGPPTPPPPRLYAAPCAKERPPAPPA